MAKTQSKNHLRKRRRRQYIRLYKFLAVYVCLILCTCVIYAQQLQPASPSKEQPPVVHEQKEKFHVILDAGHGGHDAGSGTSYPYEKDITLSITKRIGSILEDNGIQVSYTRESDCSLGEDEDADLQQRVALGKAKKADMFVSIHMNSVLSEERCYGFEIFYNHQGKTLAQNMEKDLSKLAYTTNRGIFYNNNLYVLCNNQIPAVLFEVGFITDKQDMNYITSSQGQTAIAKAVTNAILKSQY